MPRAAMGSHVSNDTAQDWTVIDLRGFRAAPSEDMPAAWKTAVQHYDFIVVAPELTPSTLLGAK